MAGSHDWLKIVILFSLLQWPCDAPSVPSEINIGGVFCHETNSNELKAFLLAVEHINNRTDILPSTQLIPLVNQTNWLDSFINIEAVAWQIYNDVVAIVGPLTSPMVRATQPFCNGFRVPQVAPYATDPSFDFSSSSFPYLLRMSSSDAIENQAIADFISRYNWTRLALLTSRSDYSLNGLVSLKDIASHKGWSIEAIESFYEYYNTSHINATTQLVHIRSKGVRIIVLNCIATQARVIMKQARDLGMIKDHVWIVKNGAFAFQGLYDSADNVPDYMQGIIGVKPMFGHGDMQDVLRKSWKDAGYGEILFENEVAVGHTFDSVLVIAKGLHDMLSDGHNISSVKPRFGFYDGSSTQPRPEGMTLLSYITQVNTSGVMNQLNFGTNRSPLDISFDVVNLRSFGFQKVGHWNQEEKLVLDDQKEIVWPSGKVSVPTDSSVLLENQTLRVVTIEEHPFIFAQEKVVNGKTHMIIEGYCVELLRKLAEMLSFTFEIYLAPDKHFGSMDPISKEWNGMVGDIIDGKADIAVASLTISPERQKFIDFTQPYMDLGLTVLIKPQPTKTTNYFAFFRPFRFEVWLALGVTMIIVGFFLWLFSILSPHGFYGRCVHTCHTRVPQRYLKLHDTLTLVRAFWSTVVYYVGQSSDHLHPVCASGRITVAVWWFATLIIMSTYTANLAAFLTITRFTSPISTVEDLARQKAIPYGTVGDSQPQAFFESASVPSFISMWQYMKQHHTFVENSEEGIQKVITENYAFVWDSAVLEYVVHNQANCGSLITSGNVFGRIGYGFGLAKDSPYTKQFSNAILQLRHSGYMEYLDRKWLHANDKCTGTSDGSNDNQLGFEDLAGVFIVVCAGIAVSCGILVLEWIWASWKDTNEVTKPDGTKTTLREALTDRARRLFHDWHHREDVPQVRHAKTCMADTTAYWNDNVLPVFQSVKRKVCGDVVPSVSDIADGETTIVEDLEAAYENESSDDSHYEI